MSLCGTMADTDMIADILCLTRKQKCTTNMETFLFEWHCHNTSYLQRKVLCTYFLVVVRLPFMMRVEVETDLKLPIPPPILSIPSRPPKEEEKELNSTKKEKIWGKNRKFWRDFYFVNVSIPNLSLGKDNTVSFLKRWFKNKLPMVWWVSVMS